ncbi:MAG: amidohydrolase family protein [Fibrobacteres bacterium]|nr:amidohydrolase family protein [Fibrobacterota bacterium]
MFNIIFGNCEVIDGSGAKSFIADVGITDDKISAIGNLSSIEALKRLDLSGKAIAPGFVNVHGHSDGWLIKKRNFTVQTSQGYTTELLMTDGFSYAPVNPSTLPEFIHYLRTINGLELSDYSGWETITDYMKLVDKKTSQNTLAQIPYSNLRVIADGFSDKALSSNQRSAIRKIVETEMANGAVGLSTGLDYAAQCFATTEDLIDACLPFSGSKALYITHMRYAIGRLEALKEAVEIGKKAKVGVHISHFMGRTPEESEVLIDYVNKVAVNEVDFSFDSIPYTSSCTLLGAQLPLEAWTEGSIAALNKLKEPAVQKILDEKIKLLPLDRFYIAWIPGDSHTHLFGKTLAEYIVSVNKSPLDAVTDLLLETNLSVLCVNRYVDDTAVFPFLAHDKFMLGSDGIWQPGGFLHPRTLGSTGRLLGSCVKKFNLFSMEKAVQKMTDIPCRKFGIHNRGLIKENYFADLVIFNPKTVTERAGFDNPLDSTVGIESVYVNGIEIVSNGQDVLKPETTPPGRYLKFQP